MGKDRWGDRLLFWRNFWGGALRRNLIIIVYLFLFEILFGIITGCVIFLCRLIYLFPWSVTTTYVEIQTHGRNGCFQSSPGGTSMCGSHSQVYFHDIVHFFKERKQVRYSKIFFWIRLENFAMKRMSSLSPSMVRNIVLLANIYLNLSDYIFFILFIENASRLFVLGS